LSNHARLVLYILILMEALIGSNHQATGTIDGEADDREFQIDAWASIDRHFEGLGKSLAP